MSTEEEPPVPAEDEIDFLGDLGFHSEPFPWIGAEWAFAGRSTLALRYGRGVWRGSGTLDKTKNFDREVFPAGTELRGKLLLDHGSLDLLVSLGDEPARGVRLLPIGFTFFHADLEVEGNSDTGRDSQAAVLPHFGFDGRWGQDEGFYFGGSGRLSLLGFGDDDVYLSLEVSAFAGLDLERVRIEVGARWLGVTDYGETELSISLGGPFAAVSFTF